MNKYLAAAIIGLAAAPAFAAGPSFDCAGKTHPLALLICDSPALSEIDLSYAKAYQSLRLSLPAAARDLAAEEKAFIQATISKCLGGADAERCVGVRYAAKTQQWLNRAAKSDEAASATRRPLVRIGGRYFLPIGLKSGETVNFLIDTGATTTSIPMAMAVMLIGDGAARPTAEVVSVKYADGRTGKVGVVKMGFTIAGIDLGNDIEVLATPGPVTPTLGMNILSQLPGWTIDAQNSQLVVARR